MFRFIFIIAVILTTTQAESKTQWHAKRRSAVTADPKLSAKLISPHDLTREEAELIAERMPEPYGELFLNGDVAKGARKESMAPLLCRFNGPRFMPRKPKNPPGGRWTWQVIHGPGRSWHYEWVFVEGAY